MFSSSFTVNLFALSVTFVSKAPSGTSTITLMPSSFTSCRLASEEVAISIPGVMTISLNSAFEGVAISAKESVNRYAIKHMKKTNNIFLKCLYTNFKIITHLLYPKFNDFIITYVYKISTRNKKYRHKIYDSIFHRNVHFSTNVHLLLLLPSLRHCKYTLQYYKKCKYGSYYYLCPP